MTRRGERRRRDQTESRAARRPGPLRSGAALVRVPTDLPSHREHRPDHNIPIHNATASVKNTHWQRSVPHSRRALAFDRNTPPSSWPRGPLAPHLPPPWSARRSARIAARALRERHGGGAGGGAPLRPFRRDGEPSASTSESCGEVPALNAPQLRSGAFRDARARFAAAPRPSLGCPPPTPVVRLVSQAAHAPGRRGPQQCRPAAKGRPGGRSARRRRPWAERLHVRHRCQVAKEGPPPWIAEALETLPPGAPPCRALRARWRERRRGRALGRLGTECRAGVCVRRKRLHVAQSSRDWVAFRVARADRSRDSSAAPRARPKRSRALEPRAPARSAPSGARPPGRLSLKDERHCRVVARNCGDFEVYQTVRLGAVLVGIAPASSVERPGAGPGGVACR